jgi:hypothetical protein
MGELERDMGALIGIVGRVLEREQCRIKNEIATIAAMENFPGRDASSEEIEAWRAANPWPWFEELRAYTLANSTPEVREYQTQWEPKATHDPKELP